MAIKYIKLPLNRGTEHYYVVIIIINLVSLLHLQEAKEKKTEPG